MSLKFNVSHFVHNGNAAVQVVYAHTDACMCILEAEGDVADADLVRTLVDQWSAQRYEHLEEFEKCIIDGLREINTPISTSLVCVLQQGDKLFIKTVGRGILYLKRGEKASRIVSGDSSASGFANAEDLIFATTSTLADELGPDDVLLRSYFRPEIHKNTQELVAKLSRKEQSYIAFYAKFYDTKSAEAVVDIPQIESEDSKNSQPNLLSLVVSNLTTRLSSFTKKKSITLIFLAIIFVIFVWSVGLGYHRHRQDETNKKITVAKEIIIQKLLQAEEVSFLNSARAQALIIGARADLKKLKSEIKNNKNNQLLELEKNIAQMEARVLKKEEKQHAEFFDLTVDQKDAKGDMMTYSDGKVAILNKAAGVVYILSLDKKSLQKRRAAQVSAASGIALFKDEAYVVKPKDGIYKLLEDGKSVRVIPIEKEWGSIADLQLFNNNAYILDSSRNEIYKYVAADDNKFASAGGYFKGTQPRAVIDPVSITIDGSVYIASRNAVVKYTSGLRDGFAPQFPSDNTSFRKVLTQEEEEKVYIWDKDHGIIFVINKDGGYERQIQSPILKTADDLVVHNRVAYVLKASKIFTINLN